MVTLDTLLIAGCISFGAGVLITLGFGVLIAVFRNTREKEEEEGGFAIPLSSLGGAAGGPGGGVSLMDLYRASQAAQAAGNAPPPAEPKKDESLKGGQYI